MGAISDVSSLPILRHHLCDPERVVRETCEVAIAKIGWDNSAEGKKHLQSLKNAINLFANFIVLPTTN
jgi:deoxyhypusine monooxygenase